MGSATQIPPMETFQQAQPGMTPQPAAAQTAPPAPAQPAAPVNHGHNLLRALVNGAHQVGQTLYSVNNSQEAQQQQDQLKQLQQQHDDQYRKMIFDSIADPNSTSNQRAAGAKLLQHFNDPTVQDDEKLNAITGYISAYHPQAPQNPLTPDEQAKAARIKAGLEPNADTSYRAENPAPKTPKEDGPLETGGALYGVRVGGKEYLPSDLGPTGAAPPQAKQIYATIQAAQQGKQANLDKKEQETQDRFNKSQERIASQFAQTQANLGTWSVVEGDNGKTQLLNSKTGEVKDAPGGVHKSGYYTKNIAPLEAANSNIDDYISGKVFDGPGDLTLQHEFFTATQPATGFRMTKVQQDILADSQSWLNSLGAKAHHLATGTWFSDKQREQIANAAKEAIDAKKKALAGGDPDSVPQGPQTQRLKAKAAGGSAKPEGAVGKVTYQGKKYWVDKDKNNLGEAP